VVDGSWLRVERLVHKPPDGFLPQPSTLNPQPIPEGRQIQAGCTCLENRIGVAEVGALPTPSANFKPLTKGNPMKPVLRYQSQLLFRKSYKPNRVIRIRPVKLNFSFRPVRFGLKPQIKTYECESH
jgi:hypothetical protein